MIAIIDCGMGNVGSISNMLKKIGGTDVKITNVANDIFMADGLILPGVGAFDTGMELLSEYDLISCLNTCVLKLHKPILGICLGMQILGKGSDEGVLPGLGYIDFNSIKFDADNLGLKVPHMGWDYVTILNKNSKLVKDIQPEPRYYFVHSYYAKCKSHEDVLMTCNYGIEFAAAVQHDNIFGVQFHPEKSHKYGKLIMSNFVEACLC